MSSRHRVLWIGAVPEPAVLQQFRDRQLELQTVTLEEAALQMASSRAVVFCEPDDDLAAKMHSGGLAAALSHGLLPFICADLARIGTLQPVFRDLPFITAVQKVESAGKVRIAEACARHACGPGHSRRVSIIGDEDCNEEDKLLLRRAFADCTEVTLNRMMAGGAIVFQAYAKLDKSNAGPYPLPFFVKLDRFIKIRFELDKYREYTTNFVPFFARPNVDFGRCLLGATRGVIVGNFVEHSDSLVEHVQRGTAHAAINSLFDDALRGWRAQAHFRATGVTRGALHPEGTIRSRSEGGLRRAHGYSQEAAELGATLSAAQAGDLLDGLPDIAHRRAVCHGDLHGENVRVRGTEAILIDFAQVGDGPLAMDPAALETSLALKFDCAESDWIAVMPQLFSYESLTALPQLRDPTAPLNALWNVVRQIRRYGLAEELTSGEYARAVAVQMLRHSLRRRDRGEQSVRRPAMIKLAGDLVRRLDGASPAS